PGAGHVSTGSREDLAAAPEGVGPLEWSDLGRHRSSTRGIQGQRRPQPGSIRPDEKMGSKLRGGQPMTLDHLRRYAVPRSLFSPTTLTRALDRLGFVQADPIRAPARAQDLTLRHRAR